VFVVAAHLSHTVPTFLPCLIGFCLLRLVYCAMSAFSANLRCPTPASCSSSSAHCRRHVVSCSNDRRSHIDPSWCRNQLHIRPKSACRAEERSRDSLQTSQSEKLKVPDTPPSKESTNRIIDVSVHLMHSRLLALRHILYTVLVLLAGSKHIPAAEWRNNRRTEDATTAKTRAKFSLCTNWIFSGDKTHLFHLTVRNPPLCSDLCLCFAEHTARSQVDRMAKAKAGPLTALQAHLRMCHLCRICKISMTCLYICFSIMSCYLNINQDPPCCDLLHCRL